MLIKPDFQFERLVTSDSNLNRIQSQLQELFEKLSENIFTGQGLIEIPLNPTLEAPTFTQPDQPVYVAKYTPPEDEERDITPVYAHSEKAFYPDPVFLGVSRTGAPAGFVHVSTLVHTSPNIRRAGMVIKIAGEPERSILGLSEGVGLIR